MIIKSLRHSAPSADFSVNYLFDGMSEEHEHNWVISDNIEDDQNRKSIIANYNTNAQCFRSGLKRKRTYRYHEILAFSRKNSKDLTREKLQRIGNKYRELRDPSHSSIFLCVPHIEKGKHFHLHCVISSNFLESNRSSDMMMTNSTYHNLRREMERWILKEMPELHHSTVYLQEQEIIQLLPDKFKTERRLLELESKRSKQPTAKEKVTTYIKSILEKSTSLEEFKLKIDNTDEFQTYSRKGRLTGIIHEAKKKFRFSTLGINLLEENFLVLSRLSELGAMRSKVSDSQSLER